MQSITKTEKPDIIYLHNIHNPYLVDMLIGCAPVIKFVHDHELYCLKTTRVLNGKLCNNSKSFVCLINALRGDGYRCMEQRQLSNIIRKTKFMVLNKHVHKKIHVFIAASEHMKHNLVSQGYPKNSIEVIPYFIEIPKKTHRIPKKNIILFVGRLLPEKGLDILIDILALLKKEFRCIIVGEGSKSYEYQLRANIKNKSLNSRVELVGWCENEDLSRYYQDSSLCVFPSMWPEPFGIVGIEAMAHALPVIAFNVGGISDWLKHNKTGFLVERGDKRSFAQKIDLLLTDEHLQKELGWNAYQRVLRHYTKARHIEKLLSIFTEVAERQS
jgi:glycosyltransferase involved in cell wall biosynthesis